MKVEAGRRRLDAPSAPFGHIKVFRVKGRDSEEAFFKKKERKKINVHEFLYWEYLWCFLHFLISDSSA